MKNIYIVIIALLFLSGCSRWIAPPYTNVDKLSAVKIGMALKEVNTELGIEPYDVYFKGKDGLVVLYNYRVKNKRINMIDDYNFLSSNKDTQAKEEDWYGKEYYCYVHFIDDKVKSIITDEGKVKSEDILIKNNNIYLIKKDKIGFYENNDTVIFIPMKK
ncbi:MAG: hypothetical protein ACEPOV_12275 [Hyphomicrobiales bacterium]